MSAPLHSGVQCCLQVLSRIILCAATVHFVSSIFNRSSGYSTYWGSGILLFWVISEVIPGGSMIQRLWKLQFDPLNVSIYKSFWAINRVSLQVSRNQAYTSWKFRYQCNTNGALNTTAFWYRNCCVATFQHIWYQCILPYFLFSAASNIFAQLMLIAVLNCAFWRALIS